MITGILVVGIGGQGVVTAGEVLAHAALAAGLDASKTEVTGMSQRGGVVCSQVRIGERIAASDVSPGQAQLLIAFELAEGLRWSHYLAPRGRALLDCWRSVPPVVSSGRYEYPEDPCAQMRAAGYDPVEIDARGIATAIGDVRLANAVMLGAAADRLPFPAALLRAQILLQFGKLPAMAALNARAFDAGLCLATSWIPGTIAAMETP